MTDWRTHLAEAIALGSIFAACALGWLL